MKNRTGAYAVMQMDGQLCGLLGDRQQALRVRQIANIRNLKSHLGHPGPLTNFHLTSI
jgi:hypothetical protein